MSDHQQLARIHRLLTDVAKKASEAASKVKDPINAQILQRVCMVNITMREALTGAIEHDSSKTSKPEDSDSNDGREAEGGTIVRLEP